MKIAVTGATGFVGRRLVVYLLENGHEVYALVRSREKAKEVLSSKVILVEIDMCDYAKCELLNDISCDYFVHMAWDGTAGVKRADASSQLENVRYACDAVRLAKSMGCHRFAYAGSIMEYDAASFLNSNEGNSPSASSIYSTAKLTADLMLRAVASDLGMEYVNFLISNIYGEGEISARFLISTLRKMLNNEPINLTSGNQPYDFIYIDDAVSAIYEVIFHGENQQSYYIGNPIQRPLKEYVQEMHDLVNSRSKLAFGTVPMNVRPLTYEEFETDKLSRGFGWIPKTDFKSGVEKLIAFENRGKKNEL